MRPCSFSGPLKCRAVSWRITARRIASDGEGATHLIVVESYGLPTEHDARLVAKAREKVGQARAGRLVSRGHRRVHQLLPALLVVGLLTGCTAAPASDQETSSAPAAAASTPPTPSPSPWNATPTCTASGRTWA